MKTEHKKVINFNCNQFDIKATKRSFLSRHLKSMHERNQTINLNNDEGGENDFIAEYEDKVFPKDQKSHTEHSINDFEYYEEEETKADLNLKARENQEIETKKKYLCPISFCAFSLSGKNEMTEQNHLQNNHPHISSKMSFLMLG